MTYTSSLLFIVSPVLFLFIGWVALLQSKQSARKFDYVLKNNMHNELAVDHFKNDQSSIIHSSSNESSLYAKESVWGDFGKRFLDIFVSTTLLIILFPAIFNISLLVKLDGGPVLFRQKRIGLNGSTFYLLKFRTVSLDANKNLAHLLNDDANAFMEWDATGTLKGGLHLTKIGRFLVKYSLDELPQILNVFLGNMSLVGPRPVVQNIIDNYYDKKEIMAYTSVRPGMKGLEEIIYNNTDSKKKLTSAVEYINLSSFIIDMKIIFKRIPVLPTHAEYEKYELYM